jgi:hypothetical protein
MKTKQITKCIACNRNLSLFRYSLWMDSVCFAIRKIILICIHIWLDKTWLHSNTASTWVQPRFLLRFVLLIFLFSFLCCVCLFYVLFVLFVFVRFIVCRMLRVSLDCPSLIIPSVFSVADSYAYANAGRRIMLLMLVSRVHIQCIFLTYKQFFVWTNDILIPFVN